MKPWIPHRHREVPIRDYEGPTVRIDDFDLLNIELGRHGISGPEPPEILVCVRCRRARVVPKVAA